MEQYIHFTNYSQAADIVVMAICLVMAVLVFFSFFRWTKSSRLFLTIVGLLFVAAALDVSFYTLAKMPEHYLLANWLRCAFHAVVLMVFLYYIAYICEFTHYEKAKPYRLIGNLLFIAVILAEVIVTIQGPTFTVSADGISFVRRGIFIYGYLGFTILCVILLSRVRRRLFHRIMFGFYGTIAISILILVMQGMSNQSSYTVASLLFPVIAMMYSLHSDPYDVQLGANDSKAMQDYIRACSRKGQDFVMMSLYMKEFDEEGKDMPQGLQATIRNFTYTNARKSRLFKVGKGHMILIFQRRYYPDHEKSIQTMLTNFAPFYERYRYDYKIVVSRSHEEIGSNIEYVSFVRNIHRSMTECSVHYVTSEDIAGFNRKEYILGELADISHCNNLDDPRVLVYCQPVLNTDTMTFDTAEALMRLDLKETGVVYPDQFIPLAEEQGYIHMLTNIILHKTCEAVWQFTQEGHRLRHISVNVSALELKDADFSSNIIDIIRQSDIPTDKIAIELTESKSEGDFMLMKQKIAELKKEGIRFYLDDFGTGYSSMERIMELPFDVIKFDRSLVIASREADRPREIVKNLATLFSNMGYDVLYEGIEEEEDEEICRDMSAAYLQGYKYSKPVPIEILNGFLS